MNRKHTHCVDYDQAAASVGAQMHSVRCRTCEHAMNPPHHTAKRLLELLSYDPETGAFRWRVTRSRIATAGAEAGSLHSNGYIHLMVDQRRIFAHRAAWLMMTGSHAEGLIDHIDGDKTNNRRSNLRVADKSINSLNRHKASRNSATGLLGVSAKRNKFVAELQIGDNRIRVHGFKTAEEAYSSYLALKAAHAPMAHGAPPVRECQMCGAADPAHRAVCEQLHPGVCDWTECDTEGGSHD